MQEHFKLLGRAVRDVVTGFAGVVTSISFDLYGCVQAIVTPAVNEKGETVDGRWFDMNRLRATTTDGPVMPVPSFVNLVPMPADVGAQVKGGQDLPAFPSNPVR